MLHTTLFFGRELKQSSARTRASGASPPGASAAACCGAASTRFPYPTSCTPAGRGALAPARRARVREQAAGALSGAGVARWGPAVRDRGADPLPSRLVGDGDGREHGLRSTRGGACGGRQAGAVGRGGEAERSVPGDEGLEARELRGREVAAGTRTIRGRTIVSALRDQCYRLRSF
jgi:hypothetical protein